MLAKMCAHLLVTAPSLQGAGEEMDTFLPQPTCGLQQEDTSKECCGRGLLLMQTLCGCPTIHMASVSSALAPWSQCTTEMSSQHIDPLGLGHT